MTAPRKAADPRRQTPQAAPPATIATAPKTPPAQHVIAAVPAPEHYVTAMFYREGWMMLACRCGWLGMQSDALDPDAFRTTWDSHLKGKA